MTSEDENNLNLLALFHYIVGGLTAVFSCLPFIHVFIGLAMLSGKFAGRSGAAPPEPLFGWLFVIMGAVFIVCGWSLAVCMAIAGKKLKARRGRTFCMVIAGIECLLMPFGTILGVFTLVVLNKESVRALFDAQPPADFHFSEH